MNTMKTFILMVILSLFSSPLLLAQDNETGDKVTRIIRNGNARELASHFNVSVQLTLPGDEGRFSRTQAELIIRDFFIKYPPKSYSINHKGSSSDGSKYYIGIYKSNNLTFRSYFLLKTVSGQELIHQLRFEHED